MFPETAVIHTTNTRLTAGPKQQIALATPLRGLKDIPQLHSQLNALQLISQVDTLRANEAEARANELEIQLAEQEAKYDELLKEFNLLLNHLSVNRPGPGPMSSYQAYLRGRARHPEAVVLVVQNGGPDFKTFDEDIFVVQRVCKVQPYIGRRHTCTVKPEHVRQIKDAGFQVEVVAVIK